MSEEILRFDVVIESKASLTFRDDVFQNVDAYIVPDLPLKGN